MRRSIAFLVLLPFALCCAVVWPALKALDWAQSTLHGTEPIIGSWWGEITEVWK